MAYRHGRYEGYDEGYLAMYTRVLKLLQEHESSWVCDVIEEVKKL